jgi:hypothetical protein
MRVIKAFFIALKQWLRIKQIAPIVEEMKAPEYIDLTPNEVLKIGEQSKDIVQAHARFKADYKHLAYFERKALKNKFK